MPQRKLCVPPLPDNEPIEQGSGSGSESDAEG